MFDRVVVPLDGSPLSEAVLPWVRSLAAQGSRICLIRVDSGVESAAVAYPTGMMMPMAMSMPVPLANMPRADEALRDSSTYLERVAQTFGAGAAVETQVRVGPAAQQIVAAADEHQAELIAMSTHGRTGLGRMVMGSVANDVVRDSQLPVLLLHPDQHALQAAADDSLMSGSVAPVPHTVGPAPGMRL